MTAQELVSKLIGKWEGTSRTWFEAGKLADESAVSGEFIPLLNGQFVRHVYTGTIQGKPRNGEELLTFNSVTKEYQLTWIDSFHMNYASLLSLGKADANGFSVLGQYDIADGVPRWGWRTSYQFTDSDKLLIRAYNIEPQAAEEIAIETVYQRMKA